MIASRRMACTSCRQSKSRCEKGDGRCRRCEKHGLLCKEDPQFHRNNKNRRFDELEKRLEVFMNALEHSQQGSSTAPTPQDRPRVENSPPISDRQRDMSQVVVHPAIDPSLQPSQSAGSDFLPPNDRRTVPSVSSPASVDAISRCIGAVRLKNTHINELFNVYVLFDGQSVSAVLHS
ncbi:hypothetical protein J3E69DRAFT_167979 [Trichoderma sp. SZMC 28015]